MVISVDPTSYVPHNHVEKNAKGMTKNEGTDRELFGDDFDKLTGGLTVGNVSAADSFVRDFIADLDLSKQMLETLYR